MSRNDSNAGREQRHRDALERQADRNERTIAQQLAVLDARFGKGVGAAKERTKLAKRASGVEAEAKAKANKPVHQKVKRS